MRHTLLGRTGLRVSSIAFGTMTFGTRWGFGADEAASRRMFDVYADRGGNFIDTADKYTDGESETMVGAFTKGRRERFVVASKYSVPTDATDVNSAGNGRKNLVQSLEGSLKRLGTDYLDLYWVHVYDGITPVEESIRALDDMVRAGKVLHVGYSDHPAWEVARADALAEKSGWTRPAAIQLEYNLAQRDGERELLPMAERLGLGVVCWGPLAGGALTGKYLEGEKGRVSSDAAGHYARYGDERTARIARVVVGAAAELGCSPGQLAIAWLLRQSPRFVPLIGARTPEQLADTLDAAALVVPDEIATRLEEPGRIDLGFPGEFLRQDWGRWWADLHADLDPRAKRRIVASRRPRP